MGYEINHEDIRIESSDTLQCIQMFDETLNYENQSINLGNYKDYRATKLQFHLTSPKANQSIKVSIPYVNRLTKTHAKHAAICQYNASTKQWTILSHVWNEKEKKLEFEATSVGIFGVFVNHYWYSSLTQRMADEYPNWSKIRQTKESNGQLFLNYFALELEEIISYLEWIHEQKYISTVDLGSLDWIYRYSLPVLSPEDDVQFLKAVGASMVEVPVLETMKEFFYNDQNDGGIVDYEESKFYTTKDIGNLVFNLTRNGNKSSHVIEPMDYHLWNSLDEFGLLLGVNRQDLERNQDYKERLLDVFRYPSGTHDIGLTHGIARELNLVQRKDKYNNSLIWKNDHKDLFLKNTNHKTIDYRTLRIDDKPLEARQYETDELGNIRIYAFNRGVSHTISFIAGIEKYQLYDKTNEELHKLMFQEDGLATPTLLTWVEYINTVAPVMWDRFKWDEGFWDTIDKKLTGLGYIPNTWDSNIDVWKEYKFDSDR